MSTLNKNRVGVVRGDTGGLESNLPLQARLHEVNHSFVADNTGLCHLGASTH